MKVADFMKTFKICNFFVPPPRFRLAFETITKLGKYHFPTFLIPKAQYYSVNLFDRVKYRLFTHQNIVWPVTQGMRFNSNSAQGGIDVFLWRWRKERRFTYFAHFCGYITGQHTLHNDSTIFIFSCKIFGEF